MLCNGFLQMIEPAFADFAALASASRIADADEHLQEEKRVLDNPDLTVLDVVIKAGLSESSPMHSILAVLAAVPEAKSLYTEWVMYRWTLRQDEAVHARFFQSIEPMSLFPGDYTDKCFALATPENLYDNALWRACRDKPRRQPRLMALARGLVRRNAPTARVAAELAEAEKKRKARIALNSDAGLRSVADLDAILTAERADATLALKTMRERWTADVNTLRIQTTSAKQVLEELDLDKLRTTLEKCRDGLVDVAKCTHQKALVKHDADKYFIKVARKHIGALIDLLESDEVEDHAVAGEIEKARDNVESTLGDTRRSISAEAGSAAADAAVDYLQRSYVINSRKLVHATFTDFSHLTARAAAAIDSFNFPLIARLAAAMSAQSLSLAEAIDALPPEESDTPAELLTYIKRSMQVSALEHVKDVFFRLDVNPGDDAADDPSAIRARIVAGLKREKHKVKKRIRTLFSAGAQFVKKKVMEVELEDVNATPLVDGQSAADLVNGALADLKDKLKPRIKRSTTGFVQRYSPIPSLQDFQPESAGSWRVDMGVFSAFIRDHLSPAVEALRPLPIANTIQGRIWLGDADQLCKAVVSPSFRRVFIAVRGVHQLQLEHTIVPIVA